MSFMSEVKDLQDGPVAKGQTDVELTQHSTTMVIECSMHKRANTSVRPFYIITLIYAKTTTLTNQPPLNGII